MNYSLFHPQIRSYLGGMFRVKLDIPEWYTDDEVCVVLLKKLVLVHLHDNLDKFNLLVFMTRCVVVCLCVFVRLYL